MNTQALAEKIDTGNELQIAVPTVNPVMDMIRQAVAAGQPLDVIRELKNMAKELAEDEAARAFKSAFAAFKGEVVTIYRTREVTDGPLKGRRYAELFSFVDAATPALSKHGLSASWDITKDEKDWIEVTCIIEHALGGRKTVAQGGPPDAGGAKNALQARISTVTYLERATFKAACGLAEQGDDDDGGKGAGKSGPAPLVTDAQLDEIEELIGKAGTTITAFCKVGKIDALSDLRAADFDRAKTWLNDRIKARADGAGNA